MEQSDVKVVPAANKRHSRNVSSSKNALQLEHLNEGELDPLAESAPPLPERPAERRSVPHSPLPETSPAQNLKDFSHLLRPENFHPLTTHSIPQPFRDPDLSSLGPPPSISALLENGHFRAAAVAASAALTATPPPVQDEIFRLLFIRLACLTLLGQLPQAAQESRCLQDINSPFYLTTGSSRQSILPWELRVLATRLQSISISEPRKAVIGYYDLARDARIAVQAASSEDEKRLWHDRLFDLGLRVANALVETGDVVAAARHLETMDTQSTPATDRQLVRGRLGLLYLRIGNLNEAKKYIVRDEAVPDALNLEYMDILRPLLSIAEGNYGSAASQLGATKNMLGSESSLSTTNLAVALLYAGDLNQSKRMLEELLEKGLRFPTLLFNLATIFELCTEKARTLKIQLAEDVSKQKDSFGYERSLVDFKL